MKTNVKRAFELFDGGIRPENYRLPKNWYVVGANGTSYPAKAIWALATGIPLRDFNTLEARTGLTHGGYLVISDSTPSPDDLDAAVASARLLSPGERLKRLARAPKKPKASRVTVTTYHRNPLVIAHVLERSQGKCEGCGSGAPFMRAKDQTPYLEVHHRVRLADEGDDTIEKENWGQSAL